MGDETLRLVRNIGNVANLSTPLGLLVALAARGRLRRIDGLIVAERAHLGPLPAGAVTIGSVVVIPTLTLEELQRRVPGTMEHEDAHAWQWAYCLGLPFIPLYMAAMGWSWLRTRDRASANVFEIQAGLELGGYRKRPVQRRRRDAERSA
ncbi:hypothetical protein [Tessaracoccus caeni]|uniref:hypothetical protein n=1 Tax=Tessaracoccus caeni TaxID=3031239 RepID=UPI0023DBF5AC|nr:hypothetical protein [Tessaracoccus caeni]MDF1488231.1 hypothetical protein [Tessaracoccus caeni]